MLGTIMWRLKEAINVLIGKKKTIPPNTSSKTFALQTEPVNFEKDLELKKFITETKIEFCFSEFGENRINAGGANLNGNRLDPTLTSLKKFFPNAKYTVYSDFDINIEGVNLKKISKMPFQDDGHPRHGYRIADYFKFQALLDSDADFVCVMDSDMVIASEEIYRLVYLTKVFGACTAFNVRNLLRKDMEISLDTIPVNDMSKGYGHSYNQSPLTLWKGFELGTLFYKSCCKWMTKQPSRASRVMWSAALETGYSPYLLPQQFCVCDGDEGIGDEVLLHVGHKKIADYYNIKNGVS